MEAVDYAKGHEINAMRALQICRKRHTGTSTVLSAMEWRQPSRLPTTSSGDICISACKLHKHKRFVTPDKESSMSTLWQKEEFEQIRSRESLTKKAADIKKTISDDDDCFITIKSSLVPLIEGLCAQIYHRFEISVVCSHLLLFFFVKKKI